ncbi:tail fiber assembly protein [Escherichia coli]|nr:tail fiber assembly protein [Escherichia coli]
MKPIFDKNGLATEQGEIRCFYYDAVSREYTGWSDEYINTGVSIPGHSTDIDPGDEITGKTFVFTDGTWWQEEDHRGEIVYSTIDRMPSAIDYIGPVHDGYTIIAPSGKCDKWNGGKWVTDTEAQHIADVAAAKKKIAGLLSEATATIAPLVDAQTGGYIDGTDVPRLTEWQRYRYKLTKVDTSTAPAITLPPKPEQ